MRRRALEALQLVEDRFAIDGDVDLAALTLQAGADDVFADDRPVARDETARRTDQRLAGAALADDEELADPVAVEDLDVVDEDPIADATGDVELQLSRGSPKAGEVDAAGGAGDALDRRRDQLGVALAEVEALFENLEVQLSARQVGRRSDQDRQQEAEDDEGAEGLGARREAGRPGELPESIEGAHRQDPAGTLLHPPRTERRSAH